MAVHSWMREDATPRTQPQLRGRIQQNARNRWGMEAVLAFTGLAAWIWCAYEIVRIVVK